MVNTSASPLTWHVLCVPPEAKTGPFEDFAALELGSRVTGRVSQMRVEPKDVL